VVAALIDTGEWWLTMRPERRVLIMAHTVASAGRLLDVAGVFHGDVRVQLSFTVPPYVLNRGTADFLGSHGAPLIPWRLATSQHFDLAVSAELLAIDEVDAPVALFSHGASRNKRPIPRGRGSLVIDTAVRGLTRADLVRDSLLIPSAIALGHDRELSILERGCSEALRVATVVGDPCADRLAAGLPRRAQFRAALGLRAGHKLIVLASTWHDDALLASGRHLIEEIVAQLPRNIYRLVLLAHPNITAAHGSYQLRSWLDHLIRNGVVLLPPEHAWEHVLVAADYIIGDHGSTTLYGSIAAVPVLLGTYPPHGAHPDSGAAALAAVAPRLSTSAPILDQLVHAETHYEPDVMAQVASLITSEPGGFARHTRRLLYSMLELGQPAMPPRLPQALPLLPLHTLEAWAQPNADGQVVP